MNMVDLIEKKRDGGELSTQEIEWIIRGCTSGEIPDYQLSALLMAICIRGMTERETFDLTMAMLHSGDILDLSSVAGLKADKHSTGGVGDKTSLVLCPIMASLGVKMSKMSGRGLGHTGGTLDKLESFPGFRCNLSGEEFLGQLREQSFVISGQAANLCPADKILYALRDVTGTVPSVPLIVSSIMSKKLAVGADVIVLDVKTGSGGFMKNDEDAEILARELIKVGRAAGKKVGAIVTDMDEPLGYAVGNALEVAEAIHVLQGKTEAAHLLELCLALGSLILTEGGLARDEGEARDMMLSAVQSGKALDKFAALVKAQGGDPAAVYNTDLLPKAGCVLEVPAPQSGYVRHLAASDIGRICLHLGGGRETLDSVIDPTVGIVLQKKVGDRVEAGESLAQIHAKDRASDERAAEAYLQACTITAEKPVLPPFIRRRVI
ncbi:MAG: thymidine phosphorylase [Ruminococcaceae bacterium]|nr:thymidine phosphorylase [Oscillospiraceae bacterium]